MIKYLATHLHKNSRYRRYPHPLLFSLDPSPTINYPNNVKGVRSLNNSIKC